MSEEDWSDHDSGPFCPHWDSPDDCEECKAEAAQPYRALAERAILALREFDVSGADELHAALKALDKR